MLNVSLRYLAIIIMLVLLVPVALFSYDIVEEKNHERQRELNQEMIARTATAFDTFIQQQFDLAILFSEEIISIRNLEADNVASAEAELKEALAKIQIYSSVKEFKLLTDSFIKASTKRDTYLNYQQQIQQTAIPVQTIECAFECMITVVVPVNIQGQTIGLLYSRDLLSSLLAFSQLTELDIALLTEKSIHSRNELTIWQDYAVPVLTNAEENRSILANIDSDFYDLIEAGQYASETVKYMWAHEYKQQGKSRFKLLFIDNQTSFIKSMEDEFNFAVGFISVVLMTIFLGGLAMTSNPITRLTKLGKAVTLIGEKKYDDAIVDLKKIRANKLVIDEISRVHHTLTSTVTNLKNYEQELETSNRHLEFIAMHDNVTELSNRYALSMHLAKMSDKIDHQVTLLLLDIDGFTALNENLGHEVGDQLLKTVGKRLNSVCRTETHAYRFGSDEFVLRSDNLLTEEDITDFVDRVIKIFENPISFEKLVLDVSISIGVARANTGSPEFPKLLRQADLALHKAKEDKSVAYQIFDPAMEEESKLLFRIKSDFEKSLENEEFFLCFQPMLDLKSESLVKMEALVRWVHPHLGPIFPDKFIPVLEDTGQIEKLTDWIVQKAAEKVTELNKLDLNQVKVSINISGHQATDLDYIDKIMRIVNQVGTSPSRLELEITETSIVSDFDAAKLWVKKAKEAGFEVAMDDFGTGYSSLSYLTSIDFDTVKLDRSLITDVVHDKVQQKVVNSIVTMIKSLDRKIVVEGIEEYNQFTLLRELDCDIGQGYLIARPMDDQALSSALGNYVNKCSWFGES